MNVLLTGAFGNVGQSTIDELLARGIGVRCFDLPSRRNQRIARRYGQRIDVVWGDLRHLDDVRRAVDGVDVVLHVGFIIPKLSATGIESEAAPDLAYEINVGGTRNLLTACAEQPHPPRFVFTSSLHIYGQTQHQAPPRQVTDPAQPIEHYARHKVECEAMIRGSGLEWAILRLGATLPIALVMDKGMFDVPLDNRIEYVHTRDVGRALAEAAESEEIWGRVLHIGGGPQCQHLYRDLVDRILTVTGIGPLPDEAFGSTVFCTDWLDTTESQRLLNFQQRTLNDYERDLQTLLGPRRHAIRLMRPIVRRWLLRQSPYWHAARAAHQHVEWQGKVAVITGASSGIGAAIARRLASEGMLVVLIARRRDRLDDLAAQIRAAGGEAIAIAVDLTDTEACDEVFRQVDALGRADVLINNAGLAWYGFSADMPWALASQMLQLNVSAVVHLTMLFLDAMKRRGHGHIINIGSIVGSLPSQGVALYGATKAFIDAYTTALHRELRGSPVHLSVVRPGAVQTELFETESARTSGFRMPAERLAIRPEVVANRVWKMIQRPRRVIHVPRILSLVPIVEPLFGWLIDSLGPLLLRRQLRHDAG